VRRIFIFENAACRLPIRVDAPHEEEVMRSLGVGLVLLVQAHIVWAAPTASLLQAAGLSPVTESGAAADFQLPDITGSKLRLYDQRGKVVFLNFWATWCPPCRHEMPQMEQLFQAFRQRSFVMWAVAMLEDRKQVAPFIKEQRLHFPALLDTQGEVGAQYAVMSLPTTYLIDCIGNIVGKAVGPRQWGTKAMHTLLATLLDDTHCR
jgi:peroxiredoxin